jgi:2-oxoisovalerate ferredoxin oxidoreductase beta subunit
MKVIEKPKSFYSEFDRKGGAHRQVTHYCPGCGHGVVHKLIAEAVDELGVRDRTILISPVGCSVFAYYYFDVGNVQVAHGRAPAAATGVKRARPGSIVLSYQGDGDLAAIGGNEILHAANRGEDISVFFINNAIYGMTGGQMAPTTLPGMRTTTTPRGRSLLNEGYPIKMCELLSTLEAPAYIERVTITDGKQLMRARRAVMKALKCQVEGKGFTFVEVLSQCPTGWKLDAPSSLRWIEENLVKAFPLGVYRDKVDEREPQSRKTWIPPGEEILKVLELTPESASEAPGGRDGGAAVAAGPETIRFKFAGFGGQGLMLLGEVVAAAGMRAGRHVTWLPSYGPEMRGGTANCHVVVSHKPVGSPLVTECDALVVMNRPSLSKFEETVAPGGTILYDSSLIETPPERRDVRAVAVRATEIADSIGSTKVANMVMLGAVMAHLGFPADDEVRETMYHTVTRRELLEKNFAAIEAGKAGVVAGDRAVKKPV